ncbi:MAG: hypothetical protein ABR525_04650 [Candidatus Limnocylindria bacterium]
MSGQTERGATARTAGGAPELDGADGTPGKALGCEGADAAATGAEPGAAATGAHANATTTMSASHANTP